MTGFGGPCRTLGYVLSHFASASGIVAEYIAKSNPYDAAPEQYPIDLPDVPVKLTGARTCFPGAPGKPVFRITHANRTVLFEQVTIGVNAKGVSNGATDGIYIGQQGQLTVGGLLNVSGTENGVHVDGGSLLMRENIISALTIEKVSNDGILCRSDTDPAQPSVLQSIINPGAQDTITIRGTGQHGIFAGIGCRANLVRTYVGYQPGSSCQLRADRVGIHVESTAQLNFSRGLVQCTTADGILVQAGVPAVPAPSSVVVSASTIRRVGCAGIRALSKNAVTVTGSAFNSNYWGIVQQSSKTSTVTSDWQINANQFSNSASNSFRCNGSPEAGECCTGSGCGGGGDIWNQSGLPLPALNNQFAKSPPAACLCNEALSSCNCTGWALGLTTPPAALNLLLSPYQGSGNPSIDISNYSLVANPTKCE